MSTMKKQLTVEQRVNIVKEAEQLGFNKAAPQFGPVWRKYVGLVKG